MGADPFMLSQGGPPSTYGQYIPTGFARGKFGTLTYAEPSDGQPARVAFTAKDGQQIFDLPVNSLHSVALAEYNASIEFWDGEQRHRVCLLPMGAAQANLFAEFTGETAAKRWDALLAPQAGAVPEGIAVKAPVSKGKRIARNYGLALLIALVVIVAVVIFAVV